jgi:acyl-CoA reductase-like NAD-dependent aldehyde dehydrogenase
MLTPYEMYIGGKRVPASSGETLVSVDPWQQVGWATYPAGDRSDVAMAVKAARMAFDGSDWSTDLRLRIEVLEEFARLLDENVERLATIESRDNGKTIREERGLYGAMSAYFRFATGVARAHRDAAPAAVSPDVHAVIRRVPYGVVGIQTPWNTPGLILAQSAAPALAAGNTIIVKPSEVAPISTLEIAAIAVEAGFPEGVFNVVTGLGPTVGAALSSAAGVDKLVFTGGPTAGSQVAKLAAENLVPTLLELGGKSANVVFADADLTAAASSIVDGFTAAAGQSCMCGSRALVERSVYDEVVGLILEGVDRVQLGDPSDPATDVGPISSTHHMSSIQVIVDSAVDQGGRILCGGGLAPGADHPLLLSPTVIDQVKPDMTVWQEEVFGPVLAVMPFDGEEDALRLANGTRYGLATGIWTTDLGRAHRLANQVRSGTVWVNQYRRGNPSLPLGGMGASGYGRLSGTEAFDEMTQAKSIEIAIPKVESSVQNGGVL